MTEVSLTKVLWVVWAMGTSGRRNTNGDDYGCCDHAEEAGKYFDPDYF
jgi:hypothetical protein